VSTVRARRAAGFTLVELSIAIAIVGVMAALGITNYRGYIQRVRVARAIVELKGIGIQLDVKRINDEVLPASLAAVGLAKNDPWGRPYRYLRVSGSPVALLRKDQFNVPLNSDYDLYSVGFDGLTQRKVSDPQSHDDVVRGANGAYYGLGRNY
jgi:general secretion pathway protein G